MEKIKQLFNKVGDLFKKLVGMWKKAPEGRFLTLKEMGMFGCTALGISLFASAMGYVLTYTNIPYVYKIPQIHGTIIVCASGLLCMLIQPLLGKLMDTKTTRFGRYKPYILFSLPIAVVFGALATWVPQIDATGRIVFVYLTSIPCMVLMTILNNMLYTLPNVMTPNTQERTDMMTPIGLIIGFAPSVLQIIAGPIRAHYIELGKEYMAFRLIGIISSVIAIGLTMFIIKIKERVLVSTEQKDKEATSMWEAIKLIFKNKPLLIFCLALCLGSFRDFANTYYTYVVQFRYFESVTDALNWSGLFLSIVGFASTVGMLMMPLLTRKLSKKAVLSIWVGISAISYGVTAIVGYGNIPVGTVTMLVITPLRFLATMSAIHLIVPLMMGELCDYQQWKTGKRLEGYVQMFCFSIPGVVGQVGFIVLINLLTKNTGFEIGDYSNLEYLTDAQQKIFTDWMDLVSIISAVSAVLMIIVLAFYPINKNKYVSIMKDLNAKTIVSGESESNSVQQEDTVADQKSVKIV